MNRFRCCDFSCLVAGLRGPLFDSDLVAMKHRLSDIEREKGRQGSLLLRAAQKNAFLWQVRNNLIVLARKQELGATLRERADQLNRIGIRTTTGKLLDAQKLSAALISLGADANTVKLLQIKAMDAADRFGVDDSEMVDQLWHEWLYHHTRVMVDEGRLFGISKADPFRFDPVSPFDWVKRLHPVYRDDRVRLWWYGKQMVVPQQARLVFALFGMFGYAKVKFAQQGRVRRVYFP